MSANRFQPAARSQSLHPPDHQPGSKASGQTRGESLVLQIHEYRESAKLHSPFEASRIAEEAGHGVKAKPRRQQLTAHQRCRSMNLSSPSPNSDTKSAVATYRPLRHDQDPPATARPANRPIKTRSSPSLPREKLAATPQKPVLRLRPGATPLSTAERLTLQGSSSPTRYSFRNSRFAHKERPGEDIPRDPQTAPVEKPSSSSPLARSQPATLLQMVHIELATQKIKEYLDQHWQGRAATEPSDPDRFPRRARRTSESSDPSASDSSHEMTEALEEVLALVRASSKERPTTSNEDSLQSST